MGKIRHKRVKFHNPAVKKEDTVKQNINGICGNEISNDSRMILPPIFENPFSNISITKSDLSQSLDLNNNKVRDVVGDVPGKDPLKNDLHLNKKEKRRLRRENFLKKLNATKISNEKQKAAKKRSKVPVVGDLQPLALALPDIEKILSEKGVPTISTKKNKKRKPRRLRGQLQTEDKYASIDAKGARKIQSKRTQKHMIHEICRLKKMLADPSFKNTSMKNITEMIQSNISKDSGGS